MLIWEYIPHKILVMGIIMTLILTIQCCLTNASQPLWYVRHTCVLSVIYISKKSLGSDIAYLFYHLWIQNNPRTFSLHASDFRTMICRIFFSKEKIEMRNVMFMMLCALIPDDYIFLKYFKIYLLISCVSGTCRGQKMVLCPPEPGWS